jgi:hypothetical protein
LISTIYKDFHSIDLEIDRIVKSVLWADLDWWRLSDDSQTARIGSKIEPTQTGEPTGSGLNGHNRKILSGRKARVYGV